MFVLLASAAAVSLLFVAVLTWRHAAFAGHRAVAVSLVFGAAFFLYRADGVAFGWLLPVVCAGPLACNTAVRAGFEARRRPSWHILLAGLVLVASGIAGYGWLRLTWAARLFDLVSLLLFLELPLVVMAGLPDDLMAVRRQARLWGLGTGVVVSTMIAVASLLGQGHVAMMLGAALVLVVCLCIAAFGGGSTVASVQPASALDVREMQVLGRLHQLMHDQAMHRDPNLTLSRLAQRLDVPEHRLRRVIHLGEGARNFNGYVNGLRLAEVRARLDDAACDATVLSLATDAGYNSLSAFNRAFKAAFGTTPTAYRAARTANTKATTRNSDDDTMVA